MREGTERQIDTLKKLRTILEMNRTIFSAETGIPLRTIEQWESGERKMPDYLLRFLTYYVLCKKILYKDRDEEYQNLIRKNRIDIS